MNKLSQEDRNLVNSIHLVKPELDAALIEYLCDKLVTLEKEKQELLAKLSEQERESPDTRTTPSKRKRGRFPDRPQVAPRASPRRPDGARSRPAGTAHDKPNESPERTSESASPPISGQDALKKLYDANENPQNYVGQTFVVDAELSPRQLKKLIHEHENRYIRPNSKAAFASVVIDLNDNLFVGQLGMYGGAASTLEADELNILMPAEMADGLLWKLSRGSHPVQATITIERINAKSTIPSLVRGVPGVSIDHTYYVGMVTDLKVLDEQ